MDATKFLKKYKTDQIVDLSKLFSNCKLRFDLDEVLNLQKITKTVGSSHFKNVMVCLDQHNISEETLLRWKEKGALKQAIDFYASLMCIELGYEEDYWCDILDKLSNALDNKPLLAKKNTSSTIKLNAMQIIVTNKIMEDTKSLGISETATKYLSNPTPATCFFLHYSETNISVADLLSQIFRNSRSSGGKCGDRYLKGNESIVKSLGVLAMLPSNDIYMRTSGNVFTEINRRGRTVNFLDIETRADEISGGSNARSNFARHCYTSAYNYALTEFNSTDIFFAHAAKYQKDDDLNKTMTHYLRYIKRWKHVDLDVFFSKNLLKILSLTLVNKYGDYGFPLYSYTTNVIRQESKEISDYMLNLLDDHPYISCEVLHALVECKKKDVYVPEVIFEFIDNNKRDYNLKELIILIVKQSKDLYA